jgi:RHS repeat-associated protein
LKIQYNRNRYYDYYTGRWLTHDPLGITPNPQERDILRATGQYEDGLNLYEYANTNPVSLLDPMGSVVHKPGKEGCRKWSHYRRPHRLGFNWSEVKECVRKGGSCRKVNTYITWSKRHKGALFEVWARRWVTTKYLGISVQMCKVYYRRYHYDEVFYNGIIRRVKCGFGLRVMCRCRCRYSVQITEKLVHVYKYCLGYDYYGPPIYTKATCK